MKTIVIIVYLALLNIACSQGFVAVRLRPDESISKDTYFRWDNGKKSNSYGTNSMLRVDNDYWENQERKTLMQFANVSELPDKFAFSNLSFFVDQVYTDRSYAKIYISLAKSSWSESAANFPTLNEIGNVYVYHRDESDRLFVDITKHFGKIKGSTGIALEARRGDGFKFPSSSDEDNEKRPELSVGIPFPKLVCPISSDKKGTKQVFSKSLISSHFGELWLDSYSVQGHRLLHTGIDLRCNKDYPVFAMHDGDAFNVTRATTGFGGYLSVRYNLGNGKFITSSYLHINPAANVRNGKTVKAGEQIGTIFDLRSQTGFSNHLHVQMRYGAEAINSDKGYNIVTIGRLPEQRDDTPVIDSKKKTGTLPAFPEWFIDLEHDVVWETKK